VVAHLESMLSAATDAESGMRGYVITGDDGFLEHYRSASRVCEDELRWLREATGDNPAQQERLTALGPLVSARLGIAGAVVEQRRAEGFEPARIAVAAGNGKQLHDQIRQLVGQMKNAERALVKTRD